jgi:hypothetical protein
LIADRALPNREDILPTQPPGISHDWIIGFPKLKGNHNPDKGSSAVNPCGASSTRTPGDFPKARETISEHPGKSADMQPAGAALLVAVPRLRASAWSLESNIAQKSPRGVQIAFRYVFSFQLL